MKFRATSDEKRKIVINIEAVSAYVARWKPYTIFEIEIVRRQKKGPTTPQRGYYFAAVLPALMRAVGYDPDEAAMVHRQLKIIFFHVQPDKHGVYREKDIPSVFGDESDIGMERRMAFIDWVSRKAAENGEYVEPVEKTS